MSILQGRDVRGRTLRAAPRDPVHIVLSQDGGGVLPANLTARPVDLAIEATDAEGLVAPWLDDEWWTEVIVRFGQSPVTVRFSPTPRALLHPLILSQIEMLRQVVPGWRTVGYGYLDDLSTAADIESIASSWYHEIRFIDHCRSGVPRSDRCAPNRAMGELFRLIRNAQSRIGMTTPVLVRMSSGGATPKLAASSESVRPTVSALARREHTMDSAAPNLQA